MHALLNNEVSQPEVNKITAELSTYSVLQERKQEFAKNLDKIKK